MISTTNSTIDPLNILILHHLGDPRHWRSSMVEHEFCLPLFAPNHNYIVHDCALPLPNFVKDIDFDGIVLNQKFLSQRRDPRSLNRVLKDYAFVKDSSAFKIALPQDDYDCSAILDRWMVDWNIDIVYSVCPEHWDILYPAYSLVGQMQLGYTGYVSDTMINRWKLPKPIHERTIDVSYRAAKLPPNYGSIGYLKRNIGERFCERALVEGFTLDISTDPKDTIIGAKWHAFIENSKFVLGVNSGSSLHDPEGIISHKVHDYLFRHPNASFEEVEEVCFPGLDGQYEFTAISPRNIECGLIESVQILAPGPYSNMLEAGTHYVSLDPAMANVNDVFKMIRDLETSAKIAKACKDALLSYPELRYQNHVEELIGKIANARSSSNSERETARYLRLFERYAFRMTRISPVFWFKNRIFEGLRQTLVLLGARRVKRMLLSSKIDQSKKNAQRSNLSSARRSES